MKDERDIGCIGLKVKAKNANADSLRLFCIYTNPADTRESYEVRFTDAMGWEHLSVTGKKTPSWETMCKMKDAFFRKDECCVEYHPTEKDYVNNDLHMLHVWKKKGSEFEMPPWQMIGIRELDAAQSATACRKLAESMSADEAEEILSSRYGEHISRKLRRSMKK